MESVRVFLWRASVAGFGLLLALTLACATPVQDPGHRARIQRTAGGIPHIEASDLPSLGFGTMYAQAEDNLCVLADQYLTFGAERSRYLGQGEGNRESDLFYQLLIDRGDADEALPKELEALFEGAAAGYNHFLRMSEGTQERDDRCGAASWLRPALPIDLKRVSRVDYAMAYMAPILLAAAPPERGEDSAAGGVPDEVQLAKRVDTYLEVPKQGGSNGVAIGRDLSLGAQGLLLANPHMPWNEPFQRFYAMHQTIPGEFDVIGANLIGRPRVGFGHTTHVAWTSTVSTARRLSFYRLELDPDDPTAYVFDGRSMPMQRRTVQIEILNGDGEPALASHTFYETHFGALLVESPFFAWTREQAFAVRLLDAAWRGETSIRDQYAARSVRELKAVHDRDQFLPVNLIAADADGEVLYADPGPIPNLPDALMAECAILGGAALDGTRSGCQWRDAAAAAAPGIFPPADLPSLFRTDYVTNSNDSFWLANPAEPIEGLARWLGATGTPRTIRTRSGLDMVTREIAAEGGVSLDALRDIALANESHAGRLIRDDVVEFCRIADTVDLETEIVSIREACEVLAGWDLRADLESRGALLFRRFLASVKGLEYTRHLPASLTPAIAFDATDPVGTPRGLDPSVKDLVRTHLGRAVTELRDAGIPPGVRLGDFQGVTRRGKRIPIHGGPEFEGVFNKIESDWEGAAGYPEVDRWSSSWIMAVAFEEQGPRSYGLLTYSLSSNPDSPHFMDQTERYSRKQWVELPFTAEAVAHAAERVYEVRASDRRP